MNRHSRHYTAAGSAANLGQTLGRCIGFLLVSVSLWCGTRSISLAADTSWNSAGGGLWTDAAKWSGGVPANNLNVNIINAGTKTVTIDAATPAGNLTITNLYITSTGSATNTLLVANNHGPSLNVMGTAQTDGSGSLIVSNAALQVNSTIIGNNNGLNSTLVLAEGADATVKGMSVGYFGGGVGTVRVCGGRLATTNSQTILGFVGRGNVDLSDGQWEAQNITFGNSAGGNGYLTTSGGTLTANILYVGANGRGTLTIAGGTNQISGVLYLGQYATGTGTVVMTGGRLVTTNSTSVVGHQGIGAATVSNGTWLAKAVYVGNDGGGRGTLTIAGGTNLFTGDFVAGFNGGAVGTVSLRGGRLETTGGNNYLGFVGRGYMTVTGGVWRAKDILLGVFSTGNTLTINGGQVFANKVTAGNAQANNIVSVGNGGLLEANTLVNAANAGNRIVNTGGIYQFTSATPTITPSGNPISITNGTISFRSVTTVNVKGNWSGTQLANITFGGANAFRLDAATNAASPDQSYTFAPGLGATNYTRLELLNGACYRGGDVTVGAGGSVLFSNETALLTGSLTIDGGAITVANSQATIQGDCTLGENSTIHWNSSGGAGIVTVNGTLALPNAASLVLPAPLVPEDEFTLFSSSHAIVGSPGNWTIVPSAPRHILAVVGNTVVLRLVRGTMILVR